MIYLTEENKFSSLIADKVLVEFMSQECHACSLAEPFLLELEKVYPFTIIIVDIQYNINLMKKYNITTLPTFMVFEEQKEIFKLTGFSPSTKIELEKQLRRLK